MKKTFIILLCFSVVFLSGCGKKDKYQEIMKEYAIDYYEKYMKMVDMDEYVITIDMLKNANEKVNSNYDLKILDKCNNKSSVTIIITEKGYEYKFNLKCEI